MKVDLKGRSLLTLKDLDPHEIRYLIALARRLKRERAEGKRPMRFAGHSLAMLFEKRSTRTRCAFETAFGEEGGHPVFLSAADVHLGEKESIEDTARVLGRMFDCIQFRGFRQATVETLARCSGVPVYNGLTDEYHPTQVLADLMTVEEEFTDLAGRTIVYVGDGRNNVALTLMIGCAKLGVHFTIVSPESLMPHRSRLDECASWAAASGSRIRLESSPSRPAFEGADAVYTDVWVSMGEEAKAGERLALLDPYRVTADIMSMSGREDTVFLHCLPAVKGNEVSFDVIEGPASRVWDESENRKHTIKALMLATLGLDGTAREGSARTGI